MASKKWISVLSEEELLQNQKELQNDQHSCTKTLPGKYEHMHCQYPKQSVIRKPKTGQEKKHVLFILFIWQLRNYKTTKGQRQVLSTLKTTEILNNRHLSELHSNVQLGSAWSKSHSLGGVRMMSAYDVWTFSGNCWLHILGRHKQWGKKRNLKDAFHKIKPAQPVKVALRASWNNTSEWKEVNTDTGQLFLFFSLFIYS